MKSQEEEGSNEGRSLPSPYSFSRSQQIGALLLLALLLALLLYRLC